MYIVLNNNIVLFNQVKLNRFLFTSFLMFVLFRSCFALDEVNGKEVSSAVKGEKKIEVEIKDNGQDIKMLENREVVYYENGNKRYEGEISTGKPNGIGVSYYENGNKKYEGEWQDDKRNGSGVEFDENGNKIYEGEWKDDKYNGSGVEYYENGNKIYEGEWKDDKPNGKGVGYYDNGNKQYEGEFKMVYQMVKE